MPFIRIVTNLAATYRYEELEGRRHLVVPCVISTEDVLDGSDGAFFYPADEYAKAVPTWNHKPIVVYHPTDTVGQPISACDPVVLNTRKVGILLNTVWDEKLRTEAWIDEERCLTIDKRIVENIKAGKPTEVSSGLYFDPEMVEGEYARTKKKYKGIARNHKPDHLAILPDKVGANSIADGAGLMVANAANEPEGTQLVFKRTLDNLLKRVQVSFVKNELSFSNISRSLSDLISSKVGEPGKYWDGYVCDIYSDYCVFMDKGRYYIVEYTTDGEEVQLDGKPQPVERVTQFVTKDGKTFAANEAGGLSLFTEERDMAGKFDKKAHLQKLVGNGQITEEESREIEKLPDATIEKLFPFKEKEVPAPTPVPTPTPGPTGNANPAVPPVTSTPQPNLQEWLKTQPPEVQRMVNNGLAAENRMKEHLIAVITANTANPFTKEFLQAKTVAELEGLASLASAGNQQQTPTVPTDNVGNPMFNPAYPGYGFNYAGVNGPPVTNTNGTVTTPLQADGLPLPKMDFASRGK